MDKEWFDIPGYEGYYQVNKNFDIYSFASNKVIKQYILVRHGLSYKFVSLSKDGKRKTEYIHRIVASVFIPNPLHLREVDHIDGNSLNNEVSNLRWCTTKENASNPITVARKRLNSGKIKKIPVIETTKDGKIVRTYISLRDAARETGLSHVSIKRTCENKGSSVKGRFFIFL